MIDDCTTIPTRLSTIFLNQADAKYVDDFNKNMNERLKPNKFVKYIQDEFLLPVSIDLGLQFFQIFIIESDGASEKVIGKLHIYGIPAVKHKPNEIEITFDVDTNGVLYVTGLDRDSKKSNYTRIKVLTGLTENEIADIKSKLIDIEQDKKAAYDKETIIKAAKDIFFQSEKQLLSFESEISKKSKEDAFLILDDLKSNIELANINGIKNALQLLNGTWQYITQEIYLNEQEMKIKRTIVFISYAHDDNEKGLVDLFCKELTKQLKVLEQEYSFEIFKDEKILMGEDWHARLQKEVASANVAILLLSSSFLKSDYISKYELTNFLEKNNVGKSQILCPVYFDPFNFNKYQVLKRYQFFKPNGVEYGPKYAHLKDDLCYGDLVEFDPQSGLPRPNRNRSRYMVNFVNELEKALSSY